ncbi:MAG: hypothetical protein FWF81_01285 [Defluviitaleaceae bacterium]|nr:hypothetical protein [Defluviitaleaceae bacterium]
MKNDYSRILTQSEIAASIPEKINNEPCGYEMCLFEIDVMLFADPTVFQ